MPLPDQTPKLPKLPFLIGDAALLAGAWFIAAQAPHPLPLEQTLAVVGCVACAGLIGVIPFLTDYARSQDEALDDRQRGLEALARTVAASAEQISIAAQGLQEITQLAQKNLQDAEELPRKLQEKLAEIQPRPEPARGAEKQKADKELAAALSAKTDRLEAVAEQIARGAADWAKADNAFHKLVATLEKFPSRAAKGPKAEAPAPKAEEPEPPAPAPVAPEPIAEPSAPAPESAVPAARAGGSPSRGDGGERRRRSRNGNPSRSPFRPCPPRDRQRKAPRRSRSISLLPPRRRRPRASRENPRSKCRRSRRFPRFQSRPWPSLSPSPSRPRPRRPKLPPNSPRFPRRRPPRPPRSRATARHASS